jgi:hypothetical protein
MAQVTRTKMHVVIYTQLANGTLTKLVGVHEYACIHSCLQFFFLKTDSSGLPVAGEPVTPCHSNSVHNRLHLSRRAGAATARTVGRERGSLASRRRSRGSGRAPPPAVVFPRRRKVLFATSVTLAISQILCASVFRFTSSPRPTPLLRRFSLLLYRHSQGKEAHLFSAIS